MDKWKDDMKHPGYEPEVVCAEDHTINGQGTAVSTLDHLASTPRSYFQFMFMGNLHNGVS